MRKLFLFSVLMLLFLLSTFSIAHLGGGEDVIVDDVLLDFGYEPGTLYTKDNSLFAFSLLTKDTKKTIVPQKIWIRISQQDDILFAGTFAPEADHVAFSYIFERPGEYEIRARYFYESGKKVEHDFMVDVHRKPWEYYSLLLGLLILVGILFLKHTRRKLKKRKE